jgi:uncharacterized protein (DUF1330 family)
MSCYFIAQISVHDDKEYEKYLQGVDDVFAKFNGKYLAMDQHPICLEGEWSYSRIALIEFPSPEDLRRWYDSPEYQEILQHRLRGAKCDTIMVSSFRSIHSITCSGGTMIYRNATVSDIPMISALQLKYHVSTISEADRANGFVTTLFTEEQLQELIETENGIAIACDGDGVVGYAMAASWDYWSKWPLFQHMIKDLEHTEYMGQTLSVENSYQYGPVCIDTAYRGKDVLPRLFDFSRAQMNQRYPILITFINHINPRSYAAHVNKLGLDVIKTFEFNGNHYYQLGYDTEHPIYP